MKSKKLKYKLRNFHNLNFYERDIFIVIVLIFSISENKICCTFICFFVFKLTKLDYLQLPSHFHFIYSSNFYCVEV